MNLPIYLDYMASTPLDPLVMEKMYECMSSREYFGNPSSQSHRFGWQAAELIEISRQQVADLIKADPKEIIWTSGATEANNLALKGASSFYQRKGKHIITMSTEHKAVLNACAYLESQGFIVSYLKPKPDGLLSLADFEAAIRPDTILASIMWVNNETGVIQDIAEIGKIAKRNGIIFHVDAAQAAGKIAIDVSALAVDLLSLSAHKIYGPKGIGALYVRRTPRIRLTPQIHGGEQEYGLRAGTLATHQIVGMGTACMVAQQRLIIDQKNACSLGQQLWSHLQSLGKIRLNGCSQQRIPQCLNMSIEGIDSESLLLSMPNLALSTGSACHSAHNTPSHVLTAMGIKANQAHSAIRLSIGRFTTQEQIDYAVTHIEENVYRLRELSPLWLA